MKEEISISEARRFALTAQGFNYRSRNGQGDTLPIRKLINRLGLLQIDSVNVLVRAHYVPVFSRLGPYNRADFDAITVMNPRNYFEYWGHEASLLPVETHPLLRWRMANAFNGKGIWRQLEPFAGEKRKVAYTLLKRIESEGPLAASDVSGTKASKGMWNWSEAKHSFEWLFWAGLISATHRRGNFERVYDLAERVLPAKILQLPTPTEVDARQMLLEKSARALGIATAKDIRDYFRLSKADAQLPMQQLIEEKTVIPIRVRGWKEQAYLYKDAIAGRNILGSALLSPFDPLIWNRSRTERLFDFRYRLEIYTPAHQREYGYYVLPFLLDGVLVARVDLKADRKSKVMIVQGLHFEPKIPNDTFERLKEELNIMASWLGLSSVVYTTSVII